MRRVAHGTTLRVAVDTVTVCAHGYQNLSGLRHGATNDLLCPDWDIKRHNPVSVEPVKALVRCEDRVENRRSPLW